MMTRRAPVRRLPEAIFPILHQDGTTMTESELAQIEAKLRSYGSSPGPH